MRAVQAGTNYLLLYADGRVHYPFSRFLTVRFDNPHTRGLVSQALRIFERLLTAHGIELAVRAREGRCLSGREVGYLAGLCYRPLPEVEILSAKKVASITSASHIVSIRIHRREGAPRHEETAA